MKKCKHCKKEFVPSNGNQISCSTKCSKYYASKKQCKKAWGGNEWYLYYLPEHHYVGVTKNINVRMAVHRKKDNRITNDIEIINTFNNRKEALLSERTLQNIGYNGAYPYLLKKLLLNN